MSLGVKELLAQAWNLHRSGRNKEAEALCKQAQVTDSSCVQAFVALGMIYGTTSRNDLALEQMQAAEKLDPNSFAAVQWLSILFLQEGKVSEATAYAERAVRLNPNIPEAQSSLANCYLRANRFTDALEIYEKVISVRPQDAAAYAGKADALLGLNCDGEALDMLRKSVALAPTPAGLIKAATLELAVGNINRCLEFGKTLLRQNPSFAPAHAILAQALMEAGRLADAELHWSQAEKGEPRKGETEFQRANTLLRLGQFELAIEGFERALALRPDQGIGYYKIVSAKKIRQEDIELVHRMQRALPNCPEEFEELEHLHYALGKAFDDLGEFETAIRHFDSANAIRLRTTNLHFNRREWEEHTNSIIRLARPAFFERNQGQGSTSELPIFVVGMIRSGTTLVEQILSCHPEIGAAGEQAFWTSIGVSLADIDQGRVGRGRMRQYADRFCAQLQSVAPGFPRVVDKNPANFTVLGQILVAFPNAKIVCLNRNPADTAMSIWITPMRTNLPWLFDRNNIVAASLDHARLLEHWRNVLPTEQFMVLSYEELVKNREQVTRDLIAFCGLNWDDACLHPEDNSRSVRTPSFWQVRQPIYISSVDRSVRYKPWLGAFAKLLP